MQVLPPPVVAVAAVEVYRCVTETHLHVSKCDIHGHQFTPNENGPLCIKGGDDGNYSLTTAFLDKQT